MFSQIILIQFTSMLILCYEIFIYKEKAIERNESEMAFPVESLIAEWDGTSLYHPFDDFMKNNIMSRHSQLILDVDTNF